MDDNKKPEVGVSVIVMKDRKVLLGLRNNRTGRGTWGFPGGKLKYREELSHCALRELREETGIDARLIDSYPHAVTNDLFKEEGMHNVSLYFRAEYKSGVPEALEPRECEEWNWFSWHNLPNPLFLPIQNLIKQEYNPFEDKK